MRLPRRVSWGSIDELEQVCSWIYADEEDLGTKTLAINRLSAWKAVTPLPHALDSTLAILSARVLDASCQDTTIAALSLRQTYATAIIRMVNGLVDPLQAGAYARSIAAIAAQLGLPSWLVELRHAATHEDLPSLELLREACKESLSWLLDNYFHPTLNPSAPAPASTLSLRPIAPLLKSYKSLMKAVTRDGSLRKQHQDNIDTVIRDIDRWITEAKVSVDLAVNPLGCGFDDNSVAVQVDIKEWCALEFFCNGLLERGGIVPVSKRKCHAPTEPFFPTAASLAIWEPLLAQLRAAHATFPSIFISRIISILLDNLMGSNDDTDIIELDSKGLPKDLIYNEYLARWAAWAARSWTSGSEHGADLKRQVILRVAPVFTSGHNVRLEPKILGELLRAASVGFKDLEVSVKLMKSIVPADPIQPWQAHDLVHMEDRLQMLMAQTGGLHENGRCASNDATRSAIIPAAGWRLLDDQSNWLPCPIGVYCHRHHVRGKGSLHSRLCICYTTPPGQVARVLKLDFQPGTGPTMKFNSPLPQTLPKECQKAAKILSSFVDSRNNGLDGIIPRNVLQNAKGFAIFTVFKAGFLFSARAGSGIVIAKLSDGTWSAPSAIGSAGIGVGGQLGAEMTDFLVVLNSAAAVKSFMSAGSLTLGGNLSIAVGPLGRNGEAIGSLNTSGKVAAMYSYSKTRGLFGGVSIEGSVIVERQDANTLAYNQDVTAKMLLSGAVPCPDWAESLVKILESCTVRPGAQGWIDDHEEQAPYTFGGSNGSRSTSSKTQRLSSFLGKKKKDTDFPPKHWGKRTNSGSYFSNGPDDHGPAGWGGINGSSPRAPGFDDELEPGSSSTHRPSRSVGGLTSTYTPVESYNPASPFNSLPPFHSVHSTLSDVTASHSRSVSAPNLGYPNEQRDDFAGYTNPFSSTPPPEDDFEFHQDTVEPPQPRFRMKPELSKPLSPFEGVARAVALYEFKAVEAGDLSFSKGDVIIVTRKSDSTDDWWKGKLDGKEGIFPANFVEIV